MLDIAFYHTRKLNSLIRKASMMDKYKYYFCNDFDSYEYCFPNNNIESLHMVSLDHKGDVIGYLACTFDRACKKAYDIKAVNFTPNVSLTFSKDIYNFVKSLFFEYGMNKLEWDTVIGNPAEVMYDRIVTRCGGSVVGVKHETFADRKGTLHHQKFYELMRSEYIKHCKGV